jgi:glycoside/pentoside/hexuronide:cation symporter, GPH family
MQENISKPLPAALPSIHIDLNFSLVQFGTTIIWSVLDGWLLYFYLPPEGKGQALVPLALYGVVIFIAKFLNAVITPPIGYWSDHLHTRWGRRLPLMFSASLPLVAVFVLIWMPPVKGESIINLLFLGLMLILFNIFEAMVIIPLGALLPELATFDQHRVRLTMWSSVFQLLGIIVAGLAGFMIDSWGFVKTILIYAVIILPTLYLPFLTLREQSGRQIAENQQFGFIESLTITLKNQAFVVLSATGLCFWMATTFLMTVIPYIVTEVCLATISDAPYFYFAGVVTMLACYPAVNWLASRYGKWMVFAGSLLASAVALPLLMLVGPQLPFPLLAQGLSWIVLQSAAMSAVTMLPQAFAAEICDYDEKLTGQRREGAYYSAWSLLGQVIGGLAAAILPLLFMLGRSQADANGPLGVRLTGLIGGILMILAFFIFLRYPLRHLSEPAMQSRGSNES